PRLPGFLLAAGQQTFGCLPQVAVLFLARCGLPKKCALVSTLGYGACFGCHRPLQSQRIFFVFSAMRRLSHASDNAKTSFSYHTLPCKISTALDGKESKRRMGRLS